MWMRPVLWLTEPRNRTEPSISVPENQEPKKNRNSRFRFGSAPVLGFFGSVLGSRFFFSRASYNEGLGVRRRHGACRGRACSPNPVGEDGTAVELAAGRWAHSSNAVFSDSMCNAAMAAPAMTCYWSAAASRVRSCIPAPSSDARPGVRGDVHQRRAVVRAVLSSLHEIDALV